MGARPKECVIARGYNLRGLDLLGLRILTPDDSGKYDKDAAKVVPEELRRPFDFNRYYNLSEK